MLGHSGQSRSLGPCLESGSPSSAHPGAQGKRSSAAASSGANGGKAVAGKGGSARPGHSKFLSIPPKPMLWHDGEWYRCCVTKEKGERVLMEFCGLEDTIPSTWVARNSDRIWRGSYKSKDWKHLGGGAWTPKGQGPEGGKKGRRAAPAAAAAAGPGRKRGAPDAGPRIAAPPAAACAAAPDGEPSTCAAAAGGKPARGTAAAGSKLARGTAAAPSVAGQPSSDAEAEQEVCSHCSAGWTSGKWGRHPTSRQRLCGACYIYMYRHDGQMRPVNASCLQCGAVCPATGLRGRAAFRPDPATGQHWLCGRCYSDAQKQQEQQEEQQEGEGGQRKRQARQQQGGQQQQQPAQQPRSLRRSDSACQPLAKRLRNEEPEQVSTKLRQLPQQSQQQQPAVPEQQSQQEQQQQVAGLAAGTAAELAPAHTLPINEPALMADDGERHQPQQQQQQQQAEEQAAEVEAQRREGLAHQLLRHVLGRVWLLCLLCSGRQQPMQRSPALQGLQRQRKQQPLALPPLPAKQATPEQRQEQDGGDMVTWPRPPLQAGDPTVLTTGTSGAVTALDFTPSPTQRPGETGGGKKQQWPQQPLPPLPQLSALPPPLLQPHLRQPQPPHQAQPQQAGQEPDLFGLVLAAAGTAPAAACGLTADLAASYFALIDTLPLDQQAVMDSHLRQLVQHREHAAAARYMTVASLRLAGAL